MYTVQFVGLQYFSALVEGEEVALVPNGAPDSSKKGDMIPEHFASIFIEDEHYAGDDWWEELKIPHEIKLEVKLGEFRTVNVTEFRIPVKDQTDMPARVMFPCEANGLTKVNLAQSLPKLKDVKDFVLDPKPDTIANIPLPGGALEVFRFSASGIIRWLITDHDDPMTIRVSANGETKYITLNPSDEQLPTEIVFSNTIDLLEQVSSADRNGHNGHDGIMGGMHGTAAAHATHSSHGTAAISGGHMHSGTAGHFVLYAKLDKERDEDKFANPKLPDFLRSRLTPLPFHHAYLAFLSSLEETPDKPCVQTCCGGH